MWDYTEKVKDHFFNPRNAGAVAEANGTGEVGSIACGDALRLTLNVDPDTDVILDAGFETFGCGSAIASSSALTEIIKGMTVDQALKVTNNDIAVYLDGLPPEKMHCSVMGREALQAAVANYRGETWSDDHEEGALICKCFAIDAAMIERVVKENRLTTVQDVINYTKAGGGCACCHEGIEDVLAEVLSKAEMEEPVNAEPVVPAPIVSPSAPHLTDLQRIRRIEQAVASVRPTLRADGGDIELLDIDGNSVFVELSGACSGCSMASATLGLVQQRLMEATGDFIKVIPTQAKKKLVQVGG
jgi:NifU-like protein